MEAELINNPLTLEGLLSNEIVVGLVVASVIGTLVFKSAAFFNTLLDFFVRTVSIGIFIENSNRTNFTTMEKVIEKRLGQRRRLRMSHVEDVIIDGRHTQAISFGLGSGRHWFIHKRVLGYVDLSIKEPKANFFPKTIFIRAFTRDVNFIKEFTFVPSKPVTKLKIWTLGEYGWDYNGSRPLVDPENVILPDNMGQKIIDDIIKFQNNYEWYAEKGIPYKLGHLLSGVPGAGKSTIIAMVASVLKKNLAFINMNDVMNDRELMLALNTLPQNSILAIEDIDATKSVQTNRDDPKDVETTKGSTTGNGVSLSGILNVFDGPATPHGLIFFVTTNNKDALDPAIFRPGRIDKDIEFGYVNEEQCKKAYKKFFPNSTEEEINVFTKEFMSGEGQPFSKLQQVLMEKING
jgi:hypothetical protein